MKANKEIKYIGVDIGGSHITVAEVDIFGLSVKQGDKARVKVDSKGTRQHILSIWVDVIKQVMGNYDPRYIKLGLAMPGPFDYQLGISYIKGLDKYDALYGVNIREVLSVTLHILPENILFRNDAEAFLHAEVLALGIPANEKVIGVTLGTGLGSAVSFDGATKDVFRAITPFREGIAEDYISSRWFVKRYEELTGGDLIDGVEGLLSGGKYIVNDLLFKEFGTNLGRFLNTFVFEERASAVVIGGNIAKSLAYFIDELRQCIANKNIRLFQSSLWENAAIIGAVCAFKNDSSIQQKDNLKKNKIFAKSI